MPSHPERVRTASLPAGYQFGDGCGIPKWLRDYDDMIAAQIYGDMLTRSRDAFDRAGEVAALKALGFTSNRDLGDER